MRLKKWLTQNDFTYQEFADRIGVHRQTIVNILAGKDVMNSIACKIEDATLGKVTCRELRLDQEDNHSNEKRNQQQQQDSTTSNAPIGSDNAK